MIRNGTCPICTHHSIEWWMNEDETYVKICNRPKCKAGLIE